MPDGWQSICAAVRRRRRTQRGYIMMALTLAMALILITLSAGLPKLATELKRQREEELVHRGVQYTRAVRKFYRKFGSYPASMEQLEDSNHVRFLRKRYQDPMSDGDFRPLHLGEVQLLPKATPPPPGSDSSRAADDRSNPDNPSSRTGSDDGQTSPLVSLSQMGATGQVFGGGPIIGVASTSDERGFHLFNNADHYKDWLFVYSPVLDRGGLFTGPYDGIPDYGAGASGTPANTQQSGRRSQSPAQPTSTGDASNTP